MTKPHTSLLITGIVTVGFSGKITPAPGTWGTLASLPFGWILWQYTGMVGLALAICLATVVGFYATSRYQQQTGKHDPKEVVIDELVGIWITLLAVPTWVYFVPAFLLFRLFDITKPWPIGWADKKVPGALGVMLDDILAGALAAACLYGMVHIFGAMPF